VAVERTSGQQPVGDEIKYLVGLKGGYGHIDIMSNNGQ